VFADDRLWSVYQSLLYVYNRLRFVYESLLHALQGLM
jgi:hypothetical protein